MATKAKMGVRVVAALVIVMASFEGLRQAAYLDPIGIPTACFGHIEGVELGQSYTKAECEGLLREDLTKAEAVLNCFNKPLTDEQQIAVISWAFNVGVPAACGSTLVSLHNASAQPAVWCAQLDRWTKARGITLPGLVRRRAEERAWCEGRRHA